MLLGLGMKVRSATIPKLEVCLKIPVFDKFRMRLKNQVSCKLDL